MSDYRLKKWYPSLGDNIKEGDIVSNSLLASDYYKDSGFWKVGKKEVENNPEFWEKIIEKDYEILSVLFNNNVYTLDNPDSRIYCGFGAGNCICLNHYENKYEIQSVKRLSDGQVFNIKDKIHFKSTHGNNNYDIIRGFKLESYDVLKVETIYGLVKLTEIQKYKEPLFTTYDGVELFGGESVYGVTDSLQLCYTSIATKENIQAVRVFAKKENAEKYIRDKEKRYSLNDIRETVNKLGCFGTTLIEYLEKNEKTTDINGNKRL